MNFTLYYFPGAVCAQKALLTLICKDVPFESVSLSREDLTSASYLALNPKGVVPTLVCDGNLVVTESSTIMRFVDETMPGPSLQPNRPEQRAVMNNWLKLMDEELFPAVGYFTVATAMRSALSDLPDPELQRRMARTSGMAVGMFRSEAVRSGVASSAVMSAVSTWEQTFTRMERDLAGNAWLAGPDISLADLAIAPAFLRLADLGLAPWWRARAGVTRWWAQIEAILEKAQFAENFPNPMTERLFETGEELRSLVLARA